MNNRLKQKIKTKIEHFWGIKIKKKNLTMKFRDLIL